MNSDDEPNCDRFLEFRLVIFDNPLPMFSNHCQIEVSIDNLHFSELHFCVIIIFIFMVHIFTYLRGDEITLSQVP